MYKIGLDWLSQPQCSTQHRRRTTARTWAECVKELGLEPDPSYSHKIQSEGGRELLRFYFRSDAQAAVFNDCVAGKASLASKPSGNVREGKGRQ